MQILAGKTLRTVPAFDAVQAVAVDARCFYAVNSRRITKHDKETGQPLCQWDGGERGPIIHLDSGVTSEGILYAAHSNWPAWPMASSVEMWDTETMAHVATYSFGIKLGSFTWLDRYNGYWWGAFANYSRVQKHQPLPYGHTYRTQVVKMDDAFRILEAWTFPDELLHRFDPMSNSGGSWGPDGRLYVTGHDQPEVYVMELPQAGSLLRWVATVRASGIEGQGIAWERGGDGPTLWGILRRERQVVQLSVPLLAGKPEPNPLGVVRGAGEFVR